MVGYVNLQNMLTDICEKYLNGYNLRYNLSQEEKVSLYVEPYRSLMQALTIPKSGISVKLREYMNVIDSYKHKTNKLEDLKLKLVKNDSYSVFIDGEFLKVYLHGEEIEPIISVGNRSLKLMVGEEEYYPTMDYDKCVGKISNTYLFINFSGIYSFKNGDEFEFFFNTFSKANEILTYVYNNFDDLVSSAFEGFILNEVVPC